MYDRDKIIADVKKALDGTFRELHGKNEPDSMWTSEIKNTFAKRAIPVGITSRQANCR